MTWRDHAIGVGSAVVIGIVIAVTAHAHPDSFNWGLVCGLCIGVLGTGLVFMLLGFAIKRGRFRREPELPATQDVSGRAAR